MVSALARAATTLLVCALAGPGCFDAHLRDPGPLVIDDFEDENLEPPLTTFDPWGCYGYNAQDPMLSCGLAPGAPGSSFALTLEFRVDDPPDGKQEHGGASLAVYDRATLDLSPYQDFVFSARLAPGMPTLPSDARLYIEFGCSTAVARDGSSPGDFYVLSSADFKSYWQTFRLDVASLGFPPWLINDVDGGPARCRQLVDSIRFTVDAFLADGESGGGVLTIDDIYLR
jgi:hypothetical protein